MRRFARDSAPLVNQSREVFHEKNVGSQCVQDHSEFVYFSGCHTRKKTNFLFCSCVFSKQIILRLLTLFTAAEHFRRDQKKKLGSVSDKIPPAAECRATSPLGLNIRTMMPSRTWFTVSEAMQQCFSRVQRKKKSLAMLLTPPILVSEHHAYTVVPR